MSVYFEAQSRKQQSFFTIVAQRGEIGGENLQNVLLQADSRIAIQFLFFPVWIKYTYNSSSIHKAVQVTIIFIFNPTIICRCITFIYTM